MPKNKKKIFFLSIFLIIILFFSIQCTNSFAQSKNEAINKEEVQTAFYFLVFFVALALGVSFLCSVAETVLMSITPSYIESIRKVNFKRAEMLTELRQKNIDRALAAILTMNTIAHTVGAIESGAQASMVFGSDWVGLFSAIMTLMILVLSEIIPKTLGALYWNSLVGVTISYIRFLILILYPIVFISEGLTKLIAGDKKIHKFSRDEFIAMADIGAQTGDLNKQESKIIQNLFKFRHLTANDIMTPRTVISMISCKLSFEKAQKILSESPFSRHPIIGQSIDDLKGFILKNEILKFNDVSKKDISIEEFKREIYVVPDTMFLPGLLEFFLNRRQHIVIVIDEFGGTKGLVTLEDVIETLLGTEIVDELDNIVDMQVLAKEKWAKRVKSDG